MKRKGETMRMAARFLMTCMVGAVVSALLGLKVSAETEAAGLERVSPQRYSEPIQSAVL